MSAGATFKKIDLHLHAPSRGQNFTLPTGEPEPITPTEKLEFARRYVRQAHETAELSMIAITNHNDTSWIDPLRQAAQELYGDEFVVLPGLEIGADGGLNSIHVLAIFPEDTPVETLERLLDDDLDLPPDARFDSANCVMPAARSFSDVVKAISSRGGLAIAAHVFSSSDSLLDSKSNQGQSRRKQFLDPNLLGLDLASYSLEQLKGKQSNWGYQLILNQHNDLTYRRPRPIGLLNNSDARRLEDGGLRYTYLKCEKPGYEALRQALLDPHARLRLQAKPPHQVRYWLKKLSVSSQSTGFLQGIEIEFNPNLNCLIGGRGTGKSAIIELMRYLWEQEPLRPDDKRRSFIDVFLPETTGAVLEVMDTRTQPATQYRVRRRGRGESKVERAEGAMWLPTQLQPRDLFRLDIYGQKEVLYTSEDVRSQLDLLDRLIGEPMNQLKRDRDAVLVDLRRNREELIALNQRLEQLAERLAQKPKIEEQLRQYQQSGLGDKAQIKRLYDRELQAWDIAAQQLATALKTADEAQTRWLLDLNYLSDDELAVLPNRDKLQALRVRLMDVNTRLSQETDTLQKLFDAAREDVAKTRQAWEQRRAAFEVGYQSALAQLPGLTPDTITRLERERLQLEMVEREQAKLQADIRALLGKRRTLLAKLLVVGDKQYAARTDKASKMTERLGRVKVEVKRGGDLAWIVEELRGYLSGTQFRGDDYQLLAKASSPTPLPLLAAIEEADTDTPASLRVYQDWLPQLPQTTLLADSADRLKQFSQITDGKKLSRLAGRLGFDQRLELDEWLIPDQVTISLNIARATERGSGQENWRALGQRLGEGVSVGQGCTAILSIILLESEQPLIIDQPEDDLDNRFIYDEVVQVLRRERDHRQVIIATHNANIPVAGDAELVIALDTQEQAVNDRVDVRCKVAANGFIDKADLDYSDEQMRSMRWHISQILEGGKTAFELRRQKYGF
jgi:DNA repair ATPase RecN